MSVSPGRARLTGSATHYARSGPPLRAWPYRACRTVRPPPSRRAGGMASRSALAAKGEADLRDINTEKIDAQLYSAPEGYEVGARRSDEQTSELQSLMRSSSAVFCSKKKNIRK